MDQSVDPSAPNPEKQSLSKRLKARAARLKLDLPALFLAFQYKDTPLLAKIFAGLTVAYALSPIDLVPDWIPVLGYLDDLLVLPLLATLAIKRIPQETWARAQRDAAGLWQNGKPKRWYYAVPIVLFWLLILWIVCKAVFPGLRGA